MKLPAKIVVWLLPMLLTACFHKTNQTQVQPLAPPIEDAPPPKPVPSPTDLPPPVVTIPNQTPAADTSAKTQPQEKPKPPVKRKKPAPAAAPPSAPAASTSNSTQQASNGTPGVSAIGQLSTGDSSDQRQETIDSMAATEKGLSGINRELNDQEQKTAAQIREYLKQAKAALASGDVDGAHTLAAKAKVLLGELSR
jgi:outer membrane biosynthesis protein TonB